MGWFTLAVAVGLCASARTQPSSRAFRLAERDLIPEGIAYDARGKKFYVSSVRKAKIVEIDASTGASREFVEEREHGFLGGVGLTVDAESRTLFAASTVTNQVRGFTSEDEGRSALFAFSLEDGSLAAAYPLGADAPHLLNDLVLGEDGSVYVTDTLTASIYVLRPSGDELEPFVRDDVISYPNGIVLMDPQTLVVAHDQGISAVHLSNGSIRLLETADHVRTVGIDGMVVHEGGIVAIQNHKGLNRVARFDVDLERGSVDAVDVLLEDHPDFDAPTTGAVVGNELFLIANSQLGRFDDDGSLPPVTALKEPVVLRLRLR